MTLEQLQQLIAAGESETLEFKKTTGQRSEAMHDLCAMLNQRGGRVLFGVDPLGQIVGQQVSDRTIEELAQEIQQIEPTVFPQIDRVDVKPGWQVIVVEVSTGPNRPYSYKGQAYKWGRGTLKMAELTQQAGLPRPEIKDLTWCLYAFDPVAISRHSKSSRI